MVYLQFDYGEKVCYIKYEKGKSETHGLPYNIYVKSHARLAVTIGAVSYTHLCLYRSGIGRIFRQYIRVF